MNNLSTMRHIFILTVFLLLITISVNAQTGKRGTVVIKKSDCLDLDVGFRSPLKDTLTISELNKQIGFFIGVKSNCSGDHKFPIQSFDMSINQLPPIHFTGPGTDNVLKNIKKEGTITVTNCIVKVINLNESDNESGKTVIIPTKTFYIIADKY